MPIWLVVYPEGMMRMTCRANPCLLLRWNFFPQDTGGERLWRIHNHLQVMRCLSATCASWRLLGCTQGFTSSASMSASSPLPCRAGPLTSSGGDEGSAGGTASTEPSKGFPRSSQAARKRRVAALNDVCASCAPMLPTIELR